jgi:hypothetical protein
VDVPEIHPEADDADGSRALSQIQRIEGLKRRVSEIVGGEMITGEAGGMSLPLNVQEQFWRNVLEFEAAETTTIRDMLAEDGFEVTPPDEVSEAMLAVTLGELIQALANRELYLEQTDHLSDRELYTLLVERVLPEERTNFPVGSGWHSHIVASEYGAPDDPEGERIYLRYYADEAVRRQWRLDFPRDDMPPHEEAPFDRDGTLPQPEFD